ncbi:DUF2694 domain-containing protein [Mycobacterium asiaticum]|uniref:DUF2694 domain-containing protein n=1 Tax=Mycobacterium asiaticum TaxID=1790 RepID=A0A1A3N9L3_MYCAS|nr:DUF2694 domain-containing protein [Mycobacterium asiaticum]OBK18471.1 DUF2694 domain-containing protein [Mycobacterium asiaticum]OBK98020.1 DUF2694 domain-containing protein [Mycobacterium asiaticum]
MDQPGNDYDSDNLSALDFSGGAAVDEASSLDALGDYAPPAESADDGTDLDALDGLTEQEEEPDLALFTVTNPAGSVSVTALMDGRVQQVTVTDKASSMSESGLAEEIFVIADLARQKARAAQHTFMVENMSEMTGDSDQQNALLHEFVGATLNLPTPEEAAAYEAQVFASRYEVDYTARYNGDK